MGEWATPYVDYVGMLQRYGVTNFLDADQREAAKKQFGPEGAEASINVIRAWLPRVMETHIDQQDACMAGHLRWLANEEDDVLGIVATGHVPGVAERLNGERELDERILNTAMWAQQKLFGDDSTVDVDELQQLREGHECDMPELSASERSKIMHAVREYFASSWSWQLSDTPVLMLYGENEPFIEAHADYLETRLADCQTMEIPGASHNAQVDNPEFIRARTREFLEEAFDNREQAVRS